MRRIMIGSGILLIAFTGIWTVALSTRFTQRFTDDWKWEANILGVTSYADEETGEFAETPLEDDPVNISVRTIEVTEFNGDSSEFTDHYRTLDPATNAVLWEFTYTASVNAETAEHTDTAYEGDYFLFPSNVEKTTYNIRNSTYQGVPMKFEKEEEILDLNTYVFTYNDSLLNSAAYESFVDLEDGQKVICFDFEMQYWVEPRTGEIVKYREWCPGDYVVDENGEQLYGLQRWGNETTGDELIRRVDQVKDRINTLNLYHLYIPLASGALGGVMLVGSFVPSVVRKTEKET
ncbi:MAG: DUF3068 domain-containing protein [Chloroflexi bacterium]|nr:DUF3068 domain-containing protein [Chloroflexota bacterium]